MAKVIERKLEYISDIDGTVEEFLLSRGYSGRIRNSLKKQMGLVLLEGSPVFVVSPIHKGDRLTVFIREEAKEIVPFDKPVNIVYEDEDIAVIDKTPDIAVIATNAHYNRSLMNALAGVWGDFVYHPVNRLDHGTSGLMAVAKNCLAHSILSESIREDKDREVKSVQREYIAVVHNYNNILSGMGEIVGDIGQPFADSMARGVVTAGGKYAKTYYEVLCAADTFSVVRLRLATGRTHQIRVHMSYIGHPLIGDDMYGGEKTYIQRPALHSSRITFIHPIDGKMIDISAKLPDDMKNLINALKKN